MAGPEARRFSAVVNRLLRRTGFQVVRARTLDRLVTAERNGLELARAELTRAEVAVPVPAPAPAPAPVPAVIVDEALASRVTALEARTEQSIQNLIRYAMKAHWRTLDLIDRVSRADKPDVCPLCGHAAADAGFREVLSSCMFFGGRLLRHECPSCNVIFGPQKMFALDAEMLDLDYRNLYRIYSESDTTALTIRTFHLLKPVQGGTYLDFGCGGEWSEAIQRLRADGWNVYGFEPNADHSSEHVFSKWEEVADKRFDGILSHNVLEHLFDPVGTTRRLKALLTDGGRIVHATPCFDYLYDYTHYHVFFFTGRSAQVLAEKAGMRIVDWVRDGEFIACTLQDAA